jgi:hypothetical protein
MARPQLTTAVTWPRYESAVLTVFTEALRRMAGRGHLPEAEEPLNLVLYWSAREVRQEMRRSGQLKFPFEIVFDSRNQPEPGDAARTEHLRKRPDLFCLMTNDLAPDYRRAQLKYYLECKRLGRPQGGRVFNDLYSEEGVSRFIEREHRYAQGCRSASMIGYIQPPMSPDDVLKEVNDFAGTRSIPSLRRAAAAWAEREVTRLQQAPLTREFETNTIQLHHFWADLRHCQFDVPGDQPPHLPAPPKPKKKKTQKKVPRK